MAIPMPPEPQDPWRNPFLPKAPKPQQPSKAEEALKAALRQSNRTHLGKMFGPQR